MSQLFDPCQVDHGNSRGRGIKITCGRCSASAKTHVGTAHNRSGEDGDHLIDRMATRRFGEWGWRVATKPGRHRCPACLAIETAAKPFAKLAKIKEASPMLAPSPSAGAAAQTEPPREMSREDRRIVFEKLNELYVNEKTGYAPGHTDKTVAEGLGCPRAWVAQVREEMFGPVNSNPEIDELIAEAKALVAEIAEHDRLMGEKITVLNARAERITKRIEAIEKAVRP